MSKRGAMSRTCGAVRKCWRRVHDGRDARLSLRAQRLQSEQSVDMSPSPRVDLIHVVEQDEWCVTVNGERVLSFSGPSAWTQALSHRAELQDLLVRDSAEKRGDAGR